MAYLLGIDVGTTNVKAVIFDEDGRTCALATEPTPTVHQGRGRALHEAEELWQTTIRVTRAALAQLTGLQAIAGVAVASMGEEGFPLDAHGQVLYPGILWYDERTQELVSWWEEQVGRARIYALTGLPLTHIFTALKLQWLYQHEPEVMQRATRWLWVSDYIAFRLGGAMATTPSLASRTMLYDLAAGAWSDELLSAAGVPRALLPEIVSSGAVLGTVSAAAAAATSLPVGTPIVAGGHDHICGCLASGAVQPGDTLHSGGTAEALARILAQPKLDRTSGEHELAHGAHVLPERYYIVGSRFSGAIINWWQRLLAPKGSLQALWRAAHAADPGANGLLFVPYMFGKGAPDPDRLATGSLLGLTADHSAGDIMRAVVEGVCYDIVELQRVLRSAVDSASTPVTAIGGLANNALWLQLKANVLNVEVRVPEQTEAVAQGAALLAGLGVGLYQDPLSMLARTLRYREIVYPEPQQVERYHGLYHHAYLPAARLVQNAVRRQF
jgi:xylulokinase